MDDVSDFLNWVVPGILIPMGAMVIRELKEIHILLAKYVEKTTSLEKRVDEHDDEFKRIWEKIT